MPEFLLSARNLFVTMVTAGLYAVFLQNLVFSGGFGATEAIRAARKNGDIPFLSAVITVFTTLVTIIARLVLGTLPAWLGQRFAWIVGVYSAVLLLLYLLVCGTAALLKVRWKRYLLTRMGMAALNTLVMAVPLISYRMGQTLPQAVAAGLCAGIAFAVASLLVNSGMHILQQNKSIPAMFTGVPATLLYTGLLSLAFTGFTGAMLAV